ncbi:MAG: hypothetical protein Q8O64_05735 [Sideroxyarcus sp.]|nr:hypothetical protein [Sideroxyarcus sp.]
MNLSFIDGRFQGIAERVSIKVDFYQATGGVALRLVGEDGLPWAVASICPDIPRIPDDCVMIKDYAENDGVAKLLIDNGILESEPLGYLPTSQFVTVGIYQMASEFLAHVEQVRVARGVLSQANEVAGAPGMM